MKVGLFIPCYVNAVYPRGGAGVVRTARARLGCEVDYPARTRPAAGSRWPMRGSRRTPGRWRNAWTRLLRRIRLRGRAVGQLRGLRARGLSAAAGRLPGACVRRCAHLGDLRVPARRGEACAKLDARFPHRVSRAQLLPRGAQDGAVVAQRAERAPIGRSCATCWRWSRDVEVIAEPERAGTSAAASAGCSPSRRTPCRSAMGRD